MKRRISCFLILAVFGISGCKVPTGLQVKSGNGSDEASPYICACKSEKTEFELDDITIQFYFGTTLSSSYQEAYQNLKELKVKLFFANDKQPFDKLPCENNENLFFIKDYDDFFSDANRKKEENDGYDYSETFKIPASLFSDHKGYIHFVLIEQLIWENGNSEYGSRGYITIFYQKNRDHVILSSEPS